MIGEKRKRSETVDKPAKLKKHGETDKLKPKFEKHGGTNKVKPAKFEKIGNTDKVKPAKFERNGKSDKVKPSKIKKQEGTDNQKPKYTKSVKKSVGDSPTKIFHAKKNFKKDDKTAGKPLKKGQESAEAPPDWAEFKKKKKELRETRRLSKITKTKPDAHSLVAQAKVISETLRRKKGTPESRVKLTEELHGLLRTNGSYKQMALAHDTTRIIQWLLKFASPHIRMEVSRELMGLLVQMIQSKYARNCVKRILKYGSGETRAQVLEALHGNIVKLASHTLSAPILDYAYGEIANKKQKLLLEQEFYGDIYRTSKDASIGHLSDTYKKSPEMKAAMLGATKDNLLRVLNKNVHDCGLVHAVLYEYLKECTSDERTELISTLCPLIAPLSNSKAGVRAAVMCVWHGSNKDKKTILKVVKEHAVSLSSHEHGHLLILAILSSVDDTVLVSKALLSTLLKEATSLAKDEWGRKVLLWLVAPGEQAHFHPATVGWLRAGAVAGASRKPAEQRAAELLLVAAPALLASLQQDSAFWMSSGALGLLTVAILKAATGDGLKSGLDAVGRHICREEWSVTEEGGAEVRGVEHTGLHVSLKRLAQGDKAGPDHTLGQAVCNHLTPQVVESWMSTNRGCFLLIVLFENNSLEVQNSLKTLIQPHVKKLKKQATGGAKILLAKITE